MEVPTPPHQHPALRPTEPYARKQPISDRYRKDKQSIIAWILVTLGGVMMTGGAWMGNKVLSAENVTTQHESRIHSMEQRADEDRAFTREQFRQQSEKLDRIMERIK